MPEAAEPILVERSGAVAILTLNRPEARNALNRPLLTALDRELRAASADAEVGVIIITGNGPAFCAGADLKEASAGMENSDFWSRYERANQSLEIHRMLPKLAKPVIAAVNGFAVAGGCGLAMSCDLVVAAETAKFGYPEPKRGLVAAMVMVSLSRAIGRRQALDLLLTGRLVEAAEARELGMINQVVPDAELMNAALELAWLIAANSASSLRVTKSLFYQVAELDYDRALDYARDVNQMIRQTRDAKSGAASFANRTKKEKQP